jgi:beta-1,4-mannosyltransferase
VHNKLPHADKYISLNKIIRKYMAHISDKLQVHCKTEIDILAPFFNVDKSKFFIVNHPEFPAEIIEKRNAVELLNKRFFHGKIESGDKLFLMFGEMAGYKGIKEIVAIFNSLNVRKKLIIGGIVKKGNMKYYNEFSSSVKNRDQILIYNKRIPDEDIPVFFNSCDYALFNFRDVLTSGSVVLALNYGKNVIVPSKGCLKELNGEKVIHFNNEEELRNILKNC